MNPFLQKFVNDGFFNEVVGNHIDAALTNNESIIIAGHRSTGTRPFMANLMAIAKKSFDTVQIKKPEDLEKDAKYILMPGIPMSTLKTWPYQGNQKARQQPHHSTEEPEQPVSLMKIFKKLTKEVGPTTKKFHQIECDKKDGVPFVSKVTTFTMDENGKVQKADLAF